MHQIHIQYAADSLVAPDESLIQHWAETALDGNIEKTEVNIRIVEKEEMATLNQTYRNKSGATNVLSFPSDIPKSMESEFPILGDIAICADVVNHEAEQQSKSQDSHWAHMVIHGVLHLLGYDHVKDDEAEKMENLEIKIMHKLNFDNPYEDGEHVTHHE